MSREPWAEGYRTFVMHVRGRRKPTPEEFIKGMGAGVTVWDGSDGIEPVRIAPWHDESGFIGWEVSVIATFGAAMPPVGNPEVPVDLGELNLSYEDLPPLNGTDEPADPRVTRLQIEKQLVDPEDPSTWPEGTAVRWERVKAEELTPEQRAEYDEFQRQFKEGFEEEAKSNVIGEIPAEALDDKPRLN